MHISDADIEYFKRGERENPEYWNCFNGRPDFTNRAVLDLGCGHGSLCIDVAVASPTSRVIGLDINSALIEFAKWNLQANFPQLEPRVEFHCSDIRMFPVSDLDFIISRSKFEHILDLTEVLAAVEARLKPGGRVFTGFDPLFHSPFGGHGRIHDVLPFPWLPYGHLVLSERYILARVNRHREKPMASIRELGLNQFSVGDYRRLFDAAGLRVMSFKTNVPGRSNKAKVMNVLKRVSFLEKFMTYSVYAILEKPDDTSWRKACTDLPGRCAA